VLPDVREAVVTLALTVLALTVLAVCTAWSAYTAHRDGLFRAPSDASELWARRLVTDAERDGDAYDVEQGVHVVAPIMSRRAWLLITVGEGERVLPRGELLEVLAERHRVGAVAQGGVA